MIREKSSSGFLKLSKNVLQKYLSSLYGENVEISGFWRLGSEKQVSKDFKGFGYGVPYVIEFNVNGNTKYTVLE